MLTWLLHDISSYEYFAAVLRSLMIETTRDRRDVGLRFAANYDSLILNRFVNISSAETE